ncbi:alcohol dehydrogenase catalytic domain-containing protein [Limibaculum sp. M0105]|uniref:Alcohol dehydrogenase catalytic domain-containing protein n=1 Tax=Thermohalobaculum xanthum TaxID=2753746 RepID=A0A8J7M623_9RHOB|nr:alcohol dehydrogenase catalytic domain-containing protein [Thermohalobaculum xanthum]MBK0398512.1 alcohol dehydrogenase catalytic domain-containing protein [Thermohalobaculum xanthum]
MKALVYTAPRALDYREVPDAAPHTGEVLIRVDAVGICGSDMHAYQGHDERRPAPLILGHEAAGVIVGGAEAGRRVTVNPLVTCGGCPACRAGRENLCPTRQIISMPPREGAFAEMLAMPTENLVTVPDGVPLGMAALAEPLACGWHAVRLGAQALGQPLAGTRCAVLGGGAIGLGAALAALAQGAPGPVPVAEPNRLRHAAIASAGALAPHLPGEGGLDAGEADLVIDAVGYPATRAEACRLARPGGVIVHIGLGSAEGGLEIRRMTLQEITFIGTYTYTKADFRATAAAIFEGRLGPLGWAEARPLSAGAAAFAEIEAGRAAAPKIVLMPGQG